MPRTSLLAASAEDIEGSIRAVEKERAPLEEQARAVRRERSKASRRVPAPRPGNWPA